MWRLLDILYWYFVSAAVGFEEVWVEAVNIRQINCKLQWKHHGGDNFIILVRIAPLLCVRPQ